MYLENITLTKTLPCLAEPGKIIVVGEPSQSLGEVLPYMATLPSIIAYNPSTQVLTFRRQPGFLTLYADKVYITQVTDNEEGLELLTSLVDAINTTWERRHELVAVEKVTKAPRPLDVYALLPQTNCSECGEATCMAFAVKLLLQEQTLEECSPLFNDESFEERRATLEAMILA
jgi:ArsR family metal-binding transcriptional regulator